MVILKAEICTKIKNMFSFINKMLGRGTAVDFKKLVEEGALVVDVRSVQEFRSGHIKDAINIPLPSLASEAGRLKKMKKTIITCCLSGARSASAKRILEQQDIEVYNGGGWQSLQSKVR
jgi:phage shock protein E